MGKGILSFVDYIHSLISKIITSPAIINNNYG